MIAIAGEPYVPGQVRGPLSRDPHQSDVILVIDQPPLPPTAHPAGVVVVDGAPFSHPMLSLLASGIPTVMVTADQARELPMGETMVLDGSQGTVRDDLHAALLAQPPAPEYVETVDGIPVELAASVRTAAGAARARDCGATSVGLVRSEYLSPEDGSMPDRTFYEHEFTRVVKAAAPLPVTVRLIDIATDKLPAWLRGKILPGQQGVRLYDSEPLRSVLEAQLDALGALAGRYTLRVLIPYVTRADEAQRWCERLRQRLPVPVGVMAETPAAALAIQELLAAADFVALGMNDLMQCLFGADRDDPGTRQYLDPYAPSLYRFLAEVASLAGARTGELCMCGLLSQFPGVLPVLIGLGFRKFSVDPVSIPWLAQRVRVTRSLAAATLAARVCHARDSTTVRRLATIHEPLSSA